MKNFPHIIDNRRRVLLDTLVEVSKEHDEISIATGYWDLKGTEALLPYLQNYKKIRLLIGRELLIPRHQLNEIEADFPDRDIFEDLQALTPDIKLKETIINLKKLIDSKVLEVKVFKKTFLHAKCYIFGNFKSTNAVGFIGSSNFTLNGLTHNFELNASEDDTRVVLYSPQSEEQENGHLSWFEEAWNDEKCMDWTGQFIELVDTSVHGEKLFSPYEMYIKTLDLMYSHLLTEDQDIKPLSSRKLHAFQERNVKQISWRLKKNGVAMLADSVGLGKTITAISVMKQYDRRRVVVIAPASLTEQWKTEIISENLLGITVVSLQNRAEIEKEIERDHLMPISLFVIDESHNLRTHGSQRFELISSWLNNNEDADVLLLTATPVNNSIDDLTNQILLGTRGEQDLLKVNVRNSEGVVKSRSFYDALSDIKRRISLNRQEGKDMKPIYEEARQVIDPILREFVIRNTRQSIKAELGGHGLVGEDGKEQMFPDIKISNIGFDSGFYNSLNIKSSIEPIENASVETIQLTTDILIHPLRQLRLPTSEKFDTKDSTLIYKLYQYILSLSFVPYRTSMYDHRVYGKTLEDLKKIKFANEDKKKLARQLSMYGLLRIVLLKRFESSSFALLASVKKYQNRLKVFEDILKTKKVILNLTDITDIINEFTEDDYDELDLTDEDIIKQTDKLGIPVSEDTHDIKSLLEDIALEREILDSIVELAEAFKNQDSKLEKFKQTIDQITKADPNRKILVFSFFSDTINYLQESLQDKTALTSTNSAFVSGKSKNDALKSADRFSPVAKKALAEVEKSGSLTYLFSTDVLAEGQNLQDCGLLINYDLHWNPVRMIQRNGRINRLGSLFKEIEVMNMVPHKELNQFLGLVSKLEDKISLIQATIGSDSSILGEEINSIHYKGIYDEDSALATKEYERLEKEADVFTDDEYVIDLKKFYETASEEQLNTLRKIPTHKWGVIDQSKESKIPVILFTKTEFSSGDSQFTFFRNNEKAEAIDLLLAGEALQILRSNDKTRQVDKISLNREGQFNSVIKLGPQIARYDRDSQRLTPSQNEILEEARLANWSSVDREKLQKLLTTRNIFQERRARKFTRKIRELIKEGKKSQADEILNSIKKTLPDIQEEITVKSVSPIFGFVKTNN